MKTTDEIFDSFSLEEKISEKHAKEIKEILKKELADSYILGFSKGEFSEKSKIFKLNDRLCDYLDIRKDKRMDDDLVDEAIKKIDKKIADAYIIKSLNEMNMHIKEYLRNIKL